MSNALRLPLLRSALLPGLLAGLLMIAGCGGPSEEKLLASARERQAKGELDAAKLEAKSALQANPQSGSGRLLLGKLLLASGDPAGAEAELQRALELGQPEQAVLPALAEAMVMLQKGRQLLTQYGKVNLSEALADAEFKTQLALAEASDGNLPGARDLQRKALLGLPGFAPALLLGARLSSADGDQAGALQQVEDLLTQQAKLSDAWLLKAELLLRLDPGKRSEAQAAYQQALAIKPDLVAAHHAIILMHMAKPDVAAATQQFALMQKAAPKHPLTMFLDAMLAEQKGDLQRAHELTQLLLRAAPDNLQLLMLAGQVELKLNAVAQARELFGKAAQLAPKAAAPRYQLAQVHLRSGQIDKAIAVLKPLVDANPPDAKAVTLTAQAQLMAGDTKAADASFAKAAKLAPADSRLRTTIALSQLGKGQDATALAELQAIASADKGNTADLALITAKVRANDFTGAAKAIDSLAAKMPGDPLPDQLRGRIALQRNDPAAARRHFEKAVATSPDFMPALAGLATLDLSEKQPAAARTRFEAVLARNPKHAGAMLALAEIGARSGAKPAETTDWLDKAVKADPADPTSRLLLIDQLIAINQPKPALAAAQAALAALPDNVEVLDRIGRIQMALGDAQQAISAFNKLSQLAPKSPQPQLRLADAYTLAKNSQGVAAAVRKAVEIAPKSLPVQQAQATLALSEGKPAQALAAARAIQAQRPDEAVGYIVEGDVELRQKNWDGAATVLRKALGKKQPGDAAQRLHSVLTAGKKPAEAEQVASDWRKRNPTDMAFVQYLGDAALAAGNAAGAEALYRQVLEAQPANMLALNNLAYAMALMKKPGSVAMAEKALASNPEAPALLDTLAFTLAAEGQLPRAIEVQTKVVASAPQAAQFRLQLAKLHLQAGDKPSARTELATLAKLGSAFAHQAEVADLLKSAGG